MNIVWHGTIKSYTVGFFLSALLTVLAYFTASLHILQGKALISTLIGFALVQAWVQLVLFLHLGKESKPRWNLLMFFFMVTIVAIFVLGSIWIMYHLDYNM